MESSNMTSHMSSQATDLEPAKNQHLLSGKWVLWAHLPHDTEWTLKSYINILELKTAEEVIAINNTLPDKLIKDIKFEDFSTFSAQASSFVCVQSKSCFIIFLP
mgnify:CR=1 FL=1